MATIPVTGVITGGPQTGMTAPTFTLVADTYPNGSNGRQGAVSALGGTQAGVAIHSGSNPFTVAVTRPTSIRSLQAVTGQLSLIGRVPRNVWKRIVRKGAVSLAGQPYQVNIDTKITDLAAGSDTADAASVRALQSLAIGFDWQNSAAFGDTHTSGIF